MEVQAKYVTKEKMIWRSRTVLLHILMQPHVMICSGIIA